MRALSGVDEAMKIVGGPPVIVKLPHGAQGVGTMLCESTGALHALLDTLSAMGHQVLLQHYVREAKGRDLRAVVVGGRVVAAMRRTGPGDDFRSNLHRGGSCEPVTLRPAYRRCAIRSAATLGLDIAGVDMLETRSGPMVVEANSSPGLEGIELATGVDVAGHIIEHAVARARAETQP